MKNDKTGGRAFPSTGPVSEYGMSLRDYYAGKALQGFCANPAVFAANDRSGWGLVNCTDDQLSAVCLSIADAMISARTAAQATTATDQAKVEAVRAPLFDKDPTNIQY